MRSNPSFRTFRRLLASSLAAVSLAGALGACGDEPTPRVSKLPDTPPPVVQPRAVVDAGTSITRAPEPGPVVVPEAPKLQIPEKYEERIALAKKLVKEGKVDDAETVYEAAIAAEPKKASPRVELARLRLGQGDSAGARKHAEKAVELAPDSAGAWNTLGRVELMDRDHEAAIEAFAKTVELDEGYVWGWNNLGLALSQAGRWDEAVSALEQATTLENAEPYMFHNLGIAYEKSDRIEEARATYKAGAKKGSEGCKIELARLDKKDADDHTAQAGGDEAPPSQ